MTQIESILSDLEKVLNEAIEDSALNLEEFLNGKIFKLGRFIGLYNQLLKESRVDFSQDLEDLFDSQEILYKTKYEKLLADWNKFLFQIEESYLLSNKLLQTSIENDVDVLPVDIKESSDYFIEMNSSKRFENYSSFQEVCSRVGKKYLILVLLRHFA